MSTVYEVRELDADGKLVRVRAIEARAPAQAIKFASAGRFEAEPIGAKRLGELFTQHGVTAIEKAKVDE